MLHANSLKLSLLLLLLLLAALLLLQLLLTLPLLCSVFLCPFLHGATLAISSHERWPELSREMMT